MPTFNTDIVLTSPFTVSRRDLDKGSYWNIKSPLFHNGTLANLSVTDARIHADNPLQFLNRHYIPLWKSIFRVLPGSRELTVGISRAPCKFRNEFHGFVLKVNQRAAIFHSCPRHQSLNGSL